jgi:hypothetical protein
MDCSPYFGMAEDVDHIEREIAAVVAAHAGVPVEQVMLGARLWHDLRLAGDDFADVVEALHSTSGITLDGKLGDYCPTEGDLAWSFWWWPFRRVKTYRELTIKELASVARTAADVG